MNQTSTAQTTASSVPAGKCHIKSPVFIFGCHKSGTSLLRSLLDGHDQLVVFPRETHFFQYAGHWVDYALRRARPVRHNLQTLLASFCRHIDELNNSTDPYSDAVEFPGYDVDRFVSCFKEFEPKTLREQFEAYLRSLYYALFNVHLPEGSRIVEKSVENAEYASVLRWMFPDSRCVHIVRNPYASLVSTRRAKSRRGYPVMTNMAKALYNSSYYLFKNRIHLDRYLVVRYEDLVTDTQRVLRRISDFLDISFSETLLQPTILGRPWKGNSTSNTDFTGISTAPVSAWRQYVNDYEIRVVNRISSSVIQEYGYERLEPKRTRFFPLKGENFRTYIKNRALLLML